MQQTRMLLTAKSRFTVQSQMGMMNKMSPLRAFSAHKDNFMSGSNANYIDYMYSQWERDPASVHSSWNAYFSGESFDTPPTLGKTNGGVGDVSSILAAL